MTGVTPSGPGSRASHEAASSSSPEASIPNAPACPNCGEEFAVDFVASLPEQTDLTFVIQVAAGQMIQAKTLAGVVDSFDKLQKAIGKELGCKTTTLIKSLETEGDELRITFRICNASAIEARSDATPKSGAAEGESAVAKPDAQPSNPISRETRAA